MFANHSLSWIVGVAKIRNIGQANFDQESSFDTLTYFGIIAFNLMQRIIIEQTGFC